MEKIYGRPKSLTNKASTYCPGCTHGVVTRIISELVDEFGIKDKTICVAGVGCGALSAFNFNTDVTGALHGRAPATATGIKRCLPDKFVYTYQGDGDLASIGMAETLHAANRGENITIIFINNSTYGMTGGQMAPTTMVGQKSTTTQLGRNPQKYEGYPIKMCELLNQFESPQYIARFSLSSPANIIKAKAGIKKAFQLNLDNKGYSFVELLSSCPTNWGMTPLQSMEFIKKNTEKIFPLGEFRLPKEVSR
jgi:2-oxoglutarate ferredoxin oxidoreductase subunit beta